LSAALCWSLEAASNNVVHGENIESYICAGKRPLTVSVLIVVPERGAADVEQTAKIRAEVHGEQQTPTADDGRVLAQSHRKAPRKHARHRLNRLALQFSRAANEADNTSEEGRGEMICFHQVYCGQRKWRCLKGKRGHGDASV
jgi:hypothetical protein